MTNALSNRKKESYKIFDEIAGTYDFLNHFLSLGIDIYWRKKFLANLPITDSINALDLATGTGDVALTLVQDPRVKKVTGIDMSEGMIKIGAEKVKSKNLEKKIILLKGDGVYIPCADSIFDITTISFGIRNFSDPVISLQNIHRVLKPNGRLMIMEFSIPTNFFVRSLYSFYFRNILPFIGNLFSKHKDAYTYLNQTVEDFPYGNDFLVLMKNAGFINLKFTPLTFGIATLYIGDKK
jgi:demethylmenaquinone methyltransferase/2-methoxy-6-polyprenyl-1,4-benzoquinol methylase